MLAKRTLAAAVTAALGLSAAGAPVLARTLSFKPVPFPTTEAEKHSIVAASEAVVNGIPVPIAYRTLLRSGEVLPLLGGAPGETIAYGTLYKADGTALMDSGGPRISNDNDFNSLIPAGGKLYLISHFEERPGAIYQTELSQDAATGLLTPVATRPINFSALGGGWVHCAGSVSPWGTHLGSEEYEPDARQWTGTGTPSNYNAAMVAYFGYDPTPANARAFMNPYLYGWPVEVAVAPDGTPTPTKHYAMGRSSNEIAYVMPDNRTVYITDDGTNTMLLMFVADVAGKLDAGTLYAARWVQLPGNESSGGQANLRWISLGHTSSGQVQPYLTNGTTFDSIFSYTDPVGGACPPGFKSINAGHEGGFQQCLTLKPGFAPVVASRLETRRYAALMGATTEFRKMEGATYNPERSVLYLAMSEINQGMLDSTTSAEDRGGNNDIRVPRNDCGAVYALRVAGRTRDSAGGIIPSNYVARNMVAIVAGTPGGGDTKNTCDKDGLANPDNITYLPKYDTLIIGEDTGSGHQNDATWSYSVRSGSLTRIETTPYGSETTSPYWYANLNGYGYLMSVVQHPYGESDRGKVSEPESRGPAAYTGYLGPFPPLN